MRLLLVLLLLAWPVHAGDSYACAAIGGCIEVPKYFIEELFENNERLLKVNHDLLWKVKRLTAMRGCLT